MSCRNVSGRAKKVSNETNDQKYENPFHIYSKDDVQKILSSNQPLSKKDLSFMYEVVYGVPYHGKSTKQDLLQKIQDFFVMPISHNGSSEKSALKKSTDITVDFYLESTNRKYN